MNKRLIIIGAGGHGCVAADCAEAMGCFVDIVFLDSFYPAKTHLGTWPIIGKPEDAAMLSTENTVFFVAIGDNQAREKVMIPLLQENLPMVTLLHPTSVVSQHSKVATGVLICAHAVINPMSKIGLGSIINTSAVVEHECEIGDFVHISVGACLAGNVTVGHGSFVGINSTVIQKLTIGDNAILGAGSTLLTNLAKFSVAVGIPAKVIKQIN